MRDRDRRCPGCHTVVDAATAMDGSDVAPSPGDVTVCVYCTRVLIFTADGFRLPSLDELEKLAEDGDLVRAVDIATRFRDQRRRSQN